MSEPTATQLAGMNYGGQPSPAPSGLNAGQLAELTSGSLPVDGLNGGDYVADYAVNGKNFLWWKAYRAEKVVGAFGPNGEVSTPDGMILVPQTTTGFKCMLYGTRRDIVDEQYGLIEKGATGFSSLPSQAIIARHDRIAFPDTISVGRQIVQRDGSNTSAISRGMIQSFITVMKLSASGNSVIVPSDEYAIGSDSHSISWVSNTTTSSGDFISIDYIYLPLWEWLEDGSRGVVQKGLDGLYLPQRGVLIARQPE